MVRDAIKDVWYISRDVDEQPSTFEVMPDGYVDIIFYFGSPCSLSTPDGWQRLPSPFIMGLLDQPALFRVENRLDVIGIKCYPWAVFELLGVPSGTGSVCLLEHPVAQLQDTLATRLRAGNVADALAHVTEYFVQTRARTDDGLLGKAGRTMRAAGGSLPVSQVAAAADATVRTLERRFKQAAGHTVKGVSELMRFEQARNHLWLHPTANLAGIAQELGYADQSHLGRAFKRYGGTTAAAFARKAARWQGTVGTDIVAFVLA